MREGKGLAQVFVEDRRRSEALAFFQVRKARCGLDGLQSNRIKQLALPLCPRDIVSACMHICIHAVHADVSCIRWVERDEGRREERACCTCMRERVGLEEALRQRGEADQLSSAIFTMPFPA